METITARQEILHPNRLAMPRIPIRAANCNPKTVEIGGQTTTMKLFIAWDVRI